MNERVAGLLKKIRDICFSSRLAFVVSAFIFVILLASTIVSSRISSDAVIKEMMIRSDEILSHIMEKVESSMDEMDAIWISFLRIHINTAEPELTITDDYERCCFYKSTAGLFEAHPYVVSVYIYYGDGEKVYYQTRTSSGIADRKSFPDNAVYEEFEKKRQVVRRIGSAGRCYSRRFPDEGGKRKGNLLYPETAAGQFYHKKYGNHEYFTRTNHSRCCRKYSSNRMFDNS